MIDTQSLEEAGKEFGFNGEGEYTHRVGAEERSDRQGMYLVAKEVMSDLTRLQLLPMLFEKKHVENTDFLVDDALLAKVGRHTHM